MALVRPPFRFALCALLGLGCDRQREAAPRAANLVLIVVDTLRRDHVSAYHQGADPAPVATPHIDALAQRGVLFENAYTHAPITGPSHASMFTSLLPRDHGVHNNGQRLAERFGTLAERLRRSKRHTAAFVSLQALAGKFGYAQGFDHYRDDFEHFWWKSAGELNEALLPWISEHARSPLFLWVHYSDPHEPYAPPAWYQRIDLKLQGSALPGFSADGRPVRPKLALASGRNKLEFVHRGDRAVRIRFWHPPPQTSFSFGGAWTASSNQAKLLRPGARATLVVTNHSTKPRDVTVKFRPEIVLNAPDKRRGYAEEVGYVDAEIGRLFKALKRNDLWANTLIVLTADHGEELGERRGRFGHVHNLREILVRVPLIMAFPGRLPEGVRVEDPVGHIALVPTVLDQLGLPQPDKVRGRKLFPTGEIGMRPVVAQTFRPQAHSTRHAVRLGRYKYVRNKTKNGEALFDLALDPDAVTNLLKLEGSRPGGWPRIPLRRARAVLEGILASDARFPEAASERAEMSEEDIEALRALGYTL
ncbi:MAG: sulfatase [Proteobacteria bacterium]|nr:sulfatase [Pseudomonadota bacterium]